MNDHSKARATIFSPTVSKTLLAVLGAMALSIESRAGDDIRNAGRALDKIERHLAEWGHASISSFVLVPDRTTNGQFDLKYDVPLSNYVQAIRTGRQGSAALLEQVEFANQLTLRAANAVPGLNVQGAPAPLSDAAKTELKRQEEQSELLHQIRMEQYRRELARITNSMEGWQTNSLALPTNSTMEPQRTPTGPTNLVPQTPTITGTLPPSPITNGFSPISALLNSFPEAQISETALLKMAATAKETERVLNFMSHPIDVPGNKKVFFAIGQISVMPGWRTRQDYICEVSARFTFAATPETALHREVMQAEITKAETRFATASAKAAGVAGKRANPEVQGELEEATKYLAAVKRTPLYANGEPARARKLPQESFYLVSAFPFTESQ